MQPKTFAKYMSFMRTALSRCEERAVSNPQSSHNSSSNGATTWDEPAQSSAPTPASMQASAPLYSDLGLGLGRGDALLDWTSSIVAPAAAVPQAAQVKPAQDGTSGDRATVPTAASAKPPVATWSNTGDMFISTATSAQAGGGATQGRAIGGGMPMSAAMGKTHATPPTSAAAPLFTAAAGSNGHAGLRMNGVTAQFGGMSVSGPTGDPFADLLGGPISGMAAQKPPPGRAATSSLLDVAQPRKWDPFS